MFTKVTRAVLMLGASTVLAAGACARPDLPDVGSDAPTIVSSDWYNHIGTNPTIASMRGKAILLEFWATW